MHWFAKTLLIAVAAGGTAGAAPKERGDAAAEAGEAESDRKVSTKTPLNIPIPVDHSAEGLRIPSFDQQGKLQMYFNIEIAKRTDDEHLEMKSAKVETYDENGAPQMTIDLPLSVLDLKTRVITSDSPVKIHRSDFDLTGDTMIFDTQTRRGKLIGNIRMLIFNRDAFTAAPETTPAENAEEGAAQPGDEKK